MRVPRDIVVLGITIAASILLILVKPPTIHGTLPPEAPVPAYPGGPLPGDPGYDD